MIITRDQGQSMVVEQYKRYHALAVFYCTGFGKSKGALDAVRTHNLQPDNYMWSGLIIVNTVNSRELTWPNEIREWAPEYYRCIGKQIIITRYTDLKYYKGMHFDWIIADEIHNCTPQHDAYLQSMTYGGIVTMTALEPEEKEKQEIIIRLSKGRKLTITDNVAIQSNVVNDYRLRIWKVPLLDHERAKYLELCKRFMKAQEGGNRDWIKIVAGKRARFIYDCETKIKAACYLRDKIRATGKRFIMHCGTRHAAARLSPYRYYGGKNDYDLKRFMAGSINEIAACKALSESITIDDLQSALMHQISSKQYGLAQKIGRNMRLPPGQTAILHLLVAKDTVDENWMNNAIEPINPKRISYHEITHQQIDFY